MPAERPTPRFLLPVIHRTPPAQEPLHECSVACGGGTHAILSYVSLLVPQQALEITARGTDIALRFADGWRQCRFVAVQRAAEAPPFSDWLASRGLPLEEQLRDEIMCAWLIFWQETGARRADAPPTA